MIEIKIGSLWYSKKSKSGILWKVVGLEDDCVFLDSTEMGRSFPVRLVRTTRKFWKHWVKAEEKER